MLATGTYTGSERWRNPGAEIPECSFEVVVLHTRTGETLQALRTAAALATGLKARIRLLVLEVVPYPLSLDAPDIAPEFTRRHFKTIAADARIDTRIDIRLGRDEAEMLESALTPRSVIVMGVRSRWWPTRERQIAKRLKRQGHQVVFAGFRKKARARNANHCISIESRTACAGSI